MAALCPNCGYDFPLQERPRSQRRGIAYSGLADMALIIGLLATALGCIAILASVVIALLANDWGTAFARIIAFFVLLASFVVFQRVADLD